MVTKRRKNEYGNGFSLILAKIHMVTKQVATLEIGVNSLILAKIHMVTKPISHALK